MQPASPGALGRDRAQLTREFGKPVPSPYQPLQPLLQELPLLASVTALLQEPAAGLLVLQELKHGLLQPLAECLQDEVLDHQRDLSADAPSGLLGGTDMSQKKVQGEWQGNPAFHQGM